MNFDDSDDDFQPRPRHGWDRMPDVGIFSITDSADESSTENADKIQSARIKRAKARDSGDPIPVLSRRTSTFVHKSKEIMRSIPELRSPEKFDRQGSLRSQEFSVIAYDDELDDGFPVGQHNNERFIPEDEDLVYVQPPSVQPRGIPIAKSAGTSIPSKPVPSLTDAMKHFKEKVALKKSELALEAHKREQESLKLDSLRSSLASLKAQMAEIRKQLDALDT
jgi:hypothetical protein